MGGFNPINLIINTMGVFSLNQVQNQTTGQGASNLSNNSINQPQNSNNSQNIGANTTQSSFSPINYSSANNILQSPLANSEQKIISTVEIEQRANYIKDLLNLPRDFEDFIKQIESNNNPNNQMLQKLSKLLLNGKIHLPSLTVLLADNSKNAMQKLMATIMNVSKMGSNNVSQLKELMNLFATANIGATSSETVKNVLMLYLPWLPLSVRSDMNLDFNIDIFDKIQGADPDSEEAIEIIKIMIQTANYGNIMATLEIAANKEVDVFISAIESFPEKEVLEKFKKDNKNCDIRTNVTVEKNKDPENSKKIKQNIEITSSNYVSPKLILAAHSLIKIIIDVDNQNFIINEENEG